RHAGAAGGRHRRGRNQVGCAGAQARAAGGVSLSRAPRLSAVVPAEAGTHNHRAFDLVPIGPTRQDTAVPACAGTTAAGFVPRTLELYGSPLPRGRAEKAVNFSASRSRRQAEKTSRAR